MSRDGSDRINLSNSELDEFMPRYSPDGSKIVFVAKKYKTQSVFIMNRDGTEKILLTNDEGNDRHPAFSPDGSKIVFDSFRSKQSDIYWVSSKGGEIKPLFTSPFQDAEPYFSPDGKNILFISNPRGMRYRDLILLNIKKKSTVNLTATLNYLNQNPVFTGKGDRILFDSTDLQNSEIYIVDIKTKSLINLSSDSRWDCTPVL